MPAYTKHLVDVLEADVPSKLTSLEIQVQQAFSGIIRTFREMSAEDTIISLAELAYRYVPGLGETAAVSLAYEYFQGDRKTRTEAKENILSFLNEYAEYSQMLKVSGESAAEKQLQSTKGKEERLEREFDKLKYKRRKISRLKEWYSRRGNRSKFKRYRREGGDLDRQLSNTKKELYQISKLIKKYENTAEFWKSGNAAQTESLRQEREKDWQQKIKKKVFEKVYEKEAQKLQQLVMGGAKPIADTGEYKAVRDELSDLRSAIESSNSPEKIKELENRIKELEARKSTYTPRFKLKPGSVEEKKKK